MEHFYNGISGWAAFAELYVEMVKRAKDGDHFVEVGSWLGKSACLMAVEIANSRKNISFDCVDLWIDGGPDLRNTKYYTDLKTPVYDLFLQNITPVRKLIRAMKMPSVEAARFYADESIDFIMLDGDHSYEAVKADIDAWLPKMKAGGIMSGDDYGWPGVTRAVSEAFVDDVEVVWKHRDADYLKSASYWSVTV